MATLPEFKPANLTEAYTMEDLLSETPTNVGELTPDDDGKAECPSCGKRYKVSANGSLRSHNCDGIRSVAAGTKPTRTGVPRKARTKGAPPSVRRMGVALLGAGAETMAGISIATYVPMPRSDVPDEVVTLPDADLMIGPIIDRIFPELPKGAQAFVKMLSEQEDLIAAAFMWAAWSKQLKDYADVMHEQNRPKAKASQRKDSDNVVSISRPSEPTLYAGVEPFQPVAPS